MTRIPVTERGELVEPRAVCSPFDRLRTSGLRGAAVLAIVLASISCGDVVRSGRSPVYLVIDELKAARGSNPGSFTGGALLSDVLTIVTTGGVCSVTNPCQVIYDDFGSVTLRTPLKDVTNPSSPNAPTSNNEVTISRYRVVYRRTDGHNIQGVDVPYAFDGGVTGTVPFGATLDLSFELVRHSAKVESPLAALRSSGGLIYTIADITFYGADRVGNEISVTGSFQVNFGNFADQ